MNPLSDEELERYKRQMSLPGFGRAAQEALKNSTAVVAGIGGLGGTAAFYLAAAGFGKLVLVHEGSLTVSNLNRQILMTRNRVGESRVEIGKDTLLQFNPHLELEVYDEPIESARMKSYLSQADVLLDCRHNFPERRILNRAAVEAGVPMVESAMNSMEAYLFNVIPGQTACLECVYPGDPQWDPYGFSVLGAHSGALGCMAAIEAVKIVTGYGKPLQSKMLFFDLEVMEFRKFKIDRRSDCPVCSQKGS